jgi:hypothetical protein
MLGVLQRKPTQDFWYGGNSPFSDSFKMHVEKLMAVEPGWKMPNVGASNAKRAT